MNLFRYASSVGEYDGGVNPTQTVNQKSKCNIKRIRFFFNRKSLITKEPHKLDEE